MVLLSLHCILDQEHSCLPLLTTPCLKAVFSACCCRKEPSCLQAGLSTLAHCTSLANLGCTCKRSLWVKTKPILHTIFFCNKIVVLSLTGIEPSPASSWDANPGESLLGIHSDRASGAPNMMSSSCKCLCCAGHPVMPLEASFRQLGVGDSMGLSANALKSGGGHCPGPVITPGKRGEKGLGGRLVGDNKWSSSASVSSERPMLVPRCRPAWVVVGGEERSCWDVDRLDCCTHFPASILSLPQPSACRQHITRRLPSLLVCEGAGLSRASESLVHQLEQAKCYFALPL